MANAQNIIGIFLIADKNLLGLVILVSALLSIAALAWLSHRRKWPEVIALGGIVFAASLLASYLTLTLADVPFARFELISMSTND